MPFVSLTSGDPHPGLGFTFPKLLEITKQCSDKGAMAGSGQSIVAVIVASASLESFISDLIALAEFGLKPSQEVLGKLAKELIRLEEEKKQLAIKFQAAKTILSGKPFDEGRSPFQDFKLLLDLRNKLVHPKADLYYSDKEGNVIGRNSNQEIVETLAGKGLCKKPIRFRKEWIRYFEDDLRVADWAYNTASTMILGIFKVFPKESIAWLVLHSRLRGIGFV